MFGDITVTVHAKPFLASFALLCYGAYRDSKGTSCGQPNSHLMASHVNIAANVIRLGLE